MTKPGTNTEVKPLTISRRDPAGLTEVSPVATEKDLSNTFLYGGIFAAVIIAVIIAYLTRKPAAAA